MLLIKKVAFKNCHPFIKCKINLNEEHVEDSDNLDIIMNMYNLIEYSDNYEDSTASLYLFKRQDPLPNNANLAVADSFSFKYKSGLSERPTNIALNPARVEVLDVANSIWKNARIIVPLKDVLSFFRSLELLLINAKLNIQLNYTKNSVLSDNAGESTFKITKTELYVPVVTLKTEDNNKLNQLLDTKFKRTVYWNEYKSKIEDVIQLQDNNNFKRTLLDAAIPGINRLFVIEFNYNVVDPNADPIVDDANRVKRNVHRKHFLPRVDIKDYNVLIDGRNFYDQNISDDFKKHEELRKIMTGRREDYTTGSLLDYDYWKNNYKLICCDLSKQKVLDSNPKANQQIEFIYKLDNARNVGGGNSAQILTVMEKEKETNLEFSKGIVKVY